MERKKIYTVDQFQKMVGKVYWLNRNVRGWAQVKVIGFDTFPDNTPANLRVAEETETAVRYVVDPRDLIPEYRLTNKQRAACGLK